MGGAAGLGGSSHAGAGAECGPDLTTSKRIVRLTFHQVVGSLATLLDGTLAAQVAEELELPAAERRAFPPLMSPHEGSVYTELNLQKLDVIAQAAGKYVLDNFASLTGCSGDRGDSCAQEFLLGFAERAFRRPLSAGEAERLSSSYAGFLALSPRVGVERALQHGIAAVIHSPQFVYRTELGDDPNEEGRLTPPELASQLSYFLTDSPPDQLLRYAADRDELSTVPELEAQVDRLLAMAKTRDNLHSAMVAYFGYGNIDTLVLDDDAFSAALRNSMYRSGQLFLEETLWNGPLNELLLSRVGFADATLAPIYGLSEFPPAGTLLDASGFARLQLPPTRSGLLTQPAFLTTRSRPDGPSVVARGLLVRDTLLCTPPPEFPQDMAEDPPTVEPGSTPREAAEARAQDETCNHCHETIDPYGLALENFDVLGRYRETYPNGATIDPAVTLPTDAGGARVRDAVEMARELAESGALARCVTRNLFNYALADTGNGAATVDSCAIREAVSSFDGNVHTFSDAIRAIATSEAFVRRSRPAPP